MPALGLSATSASDGRLKLVEALKSPAYGYP
jgi:hypothetical protein